ncbi:ground-like domain protein [Ancylostoma ceylanicum]|uniref:Ground-like domain protein n=1 Tax=Ancylostoma ceylanicum TaxID=53326 RepID=A0A0D6LQU0_9BILA|nr:ground-like domain protein [Ancylostoma ceylanicum]
MHFCKRQYFPSFPENSLVMNRNILLGYVICVEILIASDTKASHDQKYSFPPNNTPISKVYVFGRPVYVRQPFVVPQRDDYRPMHDNHVQRDQRSYGPAAEAVGDAVEQTLAQESLVRDPTLLLPMSTIPSSTTSDRSCWCRFGVAYESMNLKTFDHCRHFRVEGGVFLTESEPSRYQLPERPYPNPNPYSALPPLLEQKQGYPLPQCYTNDSGFMCCNPKLEQVMRDVFDELASDPKWQPCNVQKIANALQNRTQSVFNTDFEALAGLGDFASKTHFYSDLICKIEVQGRFMLSYATPNRHQQLRSDVVDEGIVDMGRSSVGYV